MNHIILRKLLFIRPWSNTSLTSYLIEIRNFSRIGKGAKKTIELGTLFGALGYGPRRRDKSLPPLLYFQYPWKYLEMKLKFKWFKFFRDPSFREKDFTFGSKMALVMISDLLRERRLDSISKLTTKSGFEKILIDFRNSSEEDPRFKLLKFRVKDIIHAIPVKANTIEQNGRTYYVVDMFFVGLRNIRDFDDAERAEIQEYVQKYDEKYSESANEIIPSSKPKFEKNKRRALFAEIVARFCKECDASEFDDWTIAFYKIYAFDVLAF